jgi:glycosyltransferase involved in cell wall biosynthesis
MNWLFVTSQFPWPIIHGRWLRVYHLTRALVASGESVSILSTQVTDEGQNAYGNIGVSIKEDLYIPHLSRGQGRFPFAPVAFDANFANAIYSHAVNADVVVLSGARMLQYANEASRANLVISEMVDDPLLEFKRRKTGQANSIKAWLRSWRNRIGQIFLERYSTKFITFTSFVSEEDCRSFNRRHPQKRTVFVPNGVDTGYFARPDHSSFKIDMYTPAVVFTGHMSNPNNETAAKFLVQQVAPIIWKQLPDVHVQIVGADPSDLMLALGSERVTVTGRVDDIRPYLWNAGVVLLPMQSGTGIKNKLLEAWASSAPVVATRLACQGVPARNGENLLLRESVQALADAVVYLLQHPIERQKIASAGFKIVAAELTWAATAHRMIQAVMGK